MVWGLTRWLAQVTSQMMSCTWHRSASCHRAVSHGMLCAKPKWGKPSKVSPTPDVHTSRHVASTQFHHGRGHGRDHERRRQGPMASGGSGTAADFELQDTTIQIPGGSIGGKWNVKG